MQVTLLGTGSPIPLVERAGTAITLASGDERILLDCGQGTVQRMVEHGIDPTAIDHLFFTHHHVDHNADFFYFIITRCSRGETPISIHGPAPWTESMLDALFDIYEEDIAYRTSIREGTRSIRELEANRIEDGSEVETDQFRLTATTVKHSIETYAYRITERDTGTSVVFSGDTVKIDRLAEFARGADLLIQDGCLVSDAVGEIGEREGFVWKQYRGTVPQSIYESLQKTHATPGEAGAIAREAEVDRLIVTHLLPYRDEGRIHDLVASEFDGRIDVAYDGLDLRL